MTVTTSGGVNPPGGRSSKGLVIATDALAIYEAGSQYQVTIDDVANNPVALKMLFNELNQGKREVAAAKQGSIPPAISFVLACVNALGVVLVGIGGAYLGMTPVPALAGVILGIGAILTLISTVTPAVLALSKSRNQRQAATNASPWKAGSWAASAVHQQFSDVLRAISAPADRPSKE
jgi:hypothetical protein